VCECKLTAANQACRGAGQVLQFVVLDSAIRIARKMTMGMRSISSAGPISQDQVAFGQMRSVLAEQLNDAAGLGDKE
jgi:hypothetical protein